jgi:DnaJ-class molecular chaperone
MKICQNCKGKGELKLNADEMSWTKECPDCLGTGKELTDTERGDIIRKRKEQSQ